MQNEIVRDRIKIKYNAKPNVPDKICHRFPIHQLTDVRKKVFTFEEAYKAWEFILECTSPITSLKQILFAFPKSVRREIEDAIQDNILNDFGSWQDIQEPDQDNNMVSLKYAVNLS